MGPAAAHRSQALLICEMQGLPASRTKHESHVSLRVLSGALVALAFSLALTAAARAQVTPPPAPTPAASAAPVPSAAPTLIPYVIPTSAPFSRINLDADSIEFYWNRYIIEATGHVRLQMDDGTLITGDAFSTDLRLNRFLIAGHVRLESKGVEYEGAAFSYFLNDGRSYFLPILNEPDRWTFIGDNYAVPYLGREIPPDAFLFPDLSHDAVFLTATSAVIWPLDALLFKGTRVHVLGMKAPGGQLYFNFSSNINFRQNSLVGAAVDVGYPFAGGRWWYSTLHARYDGGPNNIGAYLGFEQHFAWDNAYIVASLNPFDRPLKQANLLASDRLNRNLQLDTFQQLNYDQYGWTTPVTAAWFGSFAATAALHNSFVRLTYNLWNYGLAGNDPDHPTNLTFQWVGFDHQLHYLPLFFRLRSGAAVYDDTYGIGTFNGTRYTNLWSTFLGGTIYTNAIKLFNDTYFVASYDRQRTFFSLPHYLDQVTVTSSLSRLIGTKAAFSITYQNVNSGDYAGAQQLALYPPTTPPDPVTGLPMLGYAAYRGLATSRGLTYQLSYTPRPTLSASLTFAHYDDFPPPVGLVSGRPPYYFNADLKLRLTPQLSLELGRSYYFNWYGAKWSPQMLIQFGP